MTTPPVPLCVAATAFIPGAGGIARVARLMALVLAGEVAARHIDLHAIGLNDEGPCRDIPIPLVASHGSRWRFAAAVQIAALSSTHFLYDSLAMSRAHGRWWRPRPLMAWIHGIEVWEGARADRLRAAERATMLLASSQYARDRADRLHGGFARAGICWLGTETDDEPQLPARSDGPPTVMVVGRLETGRDKGHRALIDAWPTVLGAVPRARLLIVGTGPDLAPMRAYAAASPASACIELTGFVPEQAMPDVWARATAFAMPSRGEGFGLVYIEAMRHGVPVIASVHDAAPEINLEGETGFNVNLERSGELSDRIVSLLRDRDLAACLGVAGRRRWQEHFRFSAFRQRFLRFLNEFLSAH